MKQVKVRSLSKKQRNSSRWASKNRNVRAHYLARRSSPKTVQTPMGNVTLGTPYGFMGPDTSKDYGKADLTKT